MLFRTAAAALVVFSSAAASANTLPGEGPRLVEAGVTITQEAIEAEDLPLAEIQRQGLLVFSTPFNALDGYGDGPTDPTDPIAPGGRPTLQGNGTFLRVNGLDGQSCLECHSIVSNASVPARFGVGGIGGSVSNAIFQPTFIDVPRANTGFNGRFINPPFLFGSGGIQLLANEMTEDLQALAQRAALQPGTDVLLETKGVSFGVLRYQDGAYDLSRVEGVDADLVVRPFGRKGEFATVRGFDLGALSFHFGIEPVESVGEGVDGDADGIVDEVTIGEVSALEIFNTTLEPPEQRIPRGDSSVVDAGALRFAEFGCAECHIPQLYTRSRHLGYRFPEIDDEPSANVFYEVDLAAKHTGFKRAQRGLVVPLFADLKRHDMGPGLAESFGSELDAFFTTARLWGVSDTAPYLHDGRATTLGEAILMHGGEAQEARDAYASATEDEKAQLLQLLHSLRTPKNPARRLLD
jgi:hypothetical protein